MRGEGGRAVAEAPCLSAHDERTRRVRCLLCPNACLLANGGLGRCKARFARNGRVIPAAYGKITSLALDPIEKKPLAAFMPGSYVLSLGSFGCNLSCPFCQNASIAQVGENDVDWRMATPEQVVAKALSLVSAGCVGIAYTYNEPVVNYEFVLDTAQAAHEAGLVNVLVSNGMINRLPLEALSSCIDAANIDLKGFSQDFYDLCGGDFGCVREAISYLAKLDSFHLEVTTLLIPGFNDDSDEVGRAARWLASLDEDIVYHLTRFFPRHRMVDRPPTPLSTLESACRAASEHLAHVVLGNV
ncbi:MAG: AmmeMemoRadiSam system radical SAM enzyme [Eggerthellaceae bacterium]|nr:AmmeMemoRadiSam system radical SAM enzyme [Eggerthellaceae bacterium]